MQPDPKSLDKPIIRLPLPRYARWAVRAWVVLFLLSPLLVFFRLSILQILMLAAAILAGFVLPFFLGRLPGELEAAPEVILLNPRAHRYAWLCLLGRDNPITQPKSRAFPVAETSLLWEAQRLSLDTGGGRVLLGQGEQMEPVMDWLLRRGVSRR